MSSALGGDHFRSHCPARRRPGIMRGWSKYPAPSGSMRSSLSPWSVLKFLVQPSERHSRRIGSGMASFSDSAIFHRLRDLVWTLGESQVIALLNAEEITALADFNEAFDSLPWRKVEGYPHISELPDDDLSPLEPTGKRLFYLLDARISALSDSPF